MSNELAPIPRPHFAVPASIGQVDLLDAFLSGRKPTTLRAYEADVEDFGRFLGAPSGRAAIGLLLAGSHGQANAVALSYRTHLAARGLKTATVARRMAALRSLVKLARTLGMVAWELDIPSPKIEAFRDTSGPGDAGWRKVLELAKAEAEGGGAIAVRNLLLVRLLHDLGLRRGEAVSIDLADVDLDAGTVGVVGKGRTEAIKVTMPKPVRAALVAWLAIRGADPGPLLHRRDRAGAGGGRLTTDGVYKIVEALGKRAGISGRLRPHGLRHQAITQVLDKNGGDLRAAARFSRHRDIRTLSVYDDNRKDLAGQMADLISEE